MILEKMFEHCTVGEDGRLRCYISVSDYLGDPDYENNVDPIDPIDLAILKGE